MVKLQSGGLLIVQISNGVYYQIKMIILHLLIFVVYCSLIIHE